MEIPNRANLAPAETNKLRNEKASIKGICLECNDFDRLKIQTLIELNIISYMAGVLEPKLTLFIY